MPPVPVGEDPLDIVCADGDSLFYVANSGSANVTCYQMYQNSSRMTANVGETPAALAYDRTRAMSAA